MPLTADKHIPHCNREEVGVKHKSAEHQHIRCGDLNWVGPDCRERHRCSERVMLFVHVAIEP
eukprot:COSAG02_NODE_107_length_36312_cov_45.037942_43_plen_62_part_00